MIVVWFFLVVPRVCLQSVIVVFPNHTHFLFLSSVFLWGFMVLGIKAYSLELVCKICDFGFRKFILVELPNK